MAETQAQVPTSSVQLARGARLQQIDVLRGLAAVTVVFSHYIPYWDRYVSVIPVLVPADTGNYAVRLFFAVSGLVIFLTLAKCRSVLDFVVLRFSRLYPTYWVTLALATTVLLGVFQQDVWLTGLLANFTMFQEFLGIPNLDNVYWSLTVELAFYLNVAWLFALGLHRYPLRCVAGWLLLSALWASTHADLRAPDRDWLALLTAVDYAPYFCIGILLYNALGRRLAGLEWLLVASALSVEWLIAGAEGLAVAVGVLVLVFAATRDHLSFAVNRVTLWLGSISYALYLIHRNVGYATLAWLGDHGVGPVLAITLTAAGALLASTLIARAVERPALHFVRRRYRALVDQAP